MVKVIANPGFKIRQEILGNATAHGMSAKSAQRHTQSTQQTGK
jgi:hypothetical protein